MLEVRDLSIPLLTQQYRRGFGLSCETRSRQLEPQFIRQTS